MNKNNPIKNFQDHLDNTLQKQLKNIQKKTKKLSKNQDYLYKIILVVFGLIAAYELSQFLIEHYTFQRAIIVFIIISFVYFFLKTRSKKSGAAKTLNFLKTHRESFVYGSFILYFFIFLSSFVFRVSDLFLYATYGFIAIYAFFKILGFQIDYSLPKTSLSNSVFLRLLLISMSILLVVCHFILQAYDVVVSTKLIYLGVGFLYIILFAFFFGKGGYKDIVWYLKSRKFKRFVASNTYNILSLLVICITLSGLAYKFGYFDNIFQKTPTKMVDQTEIEVGNTPLVEAVEPEAPTTRIVVKQISDVYRFTNRLELGSEGEDVERLQGFLKSMRYISSEPTGVFDEETRLALTSALREKCDWPETTRGILGTQAMACINSLEVQVVEDIPEDELTEEELETSSEEIVEEESVPIVEEVTPEEPIVPEVVTPEPEPVEVVEPETTPEVVENNSETNQIRRVSDLYIFTETLQAGSTGNGVSNLKDILSVLGYYRGELSPDFDEETRIALRNTLIQECNWPESTKGILGPQARSCINTLELPNQ